MKYWSLCINLQGPMQAWGVESKLSLRHTTFAPSKSGVIGLIASAMGIERNNLVNLNKLTNLKFASICINNNLKFVVNDYHTIKNVPICNGGIKDTELSNRYYLADWHFLAIIEGDKELLENIKHALQYPKWHVFLGRKCCPPACPFIYNNSLKEESINNLLSESGNYACFKEENVVNKVLISKSEFDNVISFHERIFDKRTYFEDWVDISQLKDTIFPIKG